MGDVRLDDLRGFLGRHIGIEDPVPAGELHVDQRLRVAEPQHADARHIGAAIGLLNRLVERERDFVGPGGLAGDAATYPDPRQRAGGEFVPALLSPGLELFERCCHWPLVMPCRLVARGRL